MSSGAVDGLRAVHHVGITVADLDVAVAFWQRLLGTAPRDRRLLDGPLVGVVTGYPQARIEVCWFDLPGGTALELLDYLQPSAPPYDPGTAHPGNIHLCLQVGDIEAAHTHAVACGAQPVSDTPVEIPAGPRAGTQVAYLRIHDGVTLELFRPPT